MSVDVTYSVLFPPSVLNDPVLRMSVDVKYSVLYVIDRLTDAVNDSEPHQFMQIYSAGSWSDDEIKAVFSHCIAQQKVEHLEALLEHICGEKWKQLVSDLQLLSVIKSRGNGIYVKMIIEKGKQEDCLPLLNKEDNNYFDLMVWFIIKDDFGECLKELSRISLDMNQRQGYQKTGKTPLMLACVQGSVQCVEVLLSLHYIEIDTQYRDSETALMMATQESQLECARLLVDKGADVNIEDIFGRTALMYAVKWGRCSDIAKLLLENGADLTRVTREHHTSILTLAVEAKEVECTQVLLEAGADINAQDRDGETALMVAVKQAFMPIVQLLIRHGVNVNIESSNRQTALLWALYREHKDIVEMLIEVGVTIDYDVCVVAIRREYGRIFQLMIEKNPSVLDQVNDNNGRYLMQAAAFHRSEKCLDFLLNDHIAKGRSVNLVDNRGFTPIVLSCLMETGPSTTVMEKLIEKGANMNVIVNDRLSLLAYVIYRYFGFHEAISLVKCMIKYGCDVNFPTAFTNGSEMTLPLEGVLRCQAYGIAEMLFEAGSDRGRTARWGKHQPLPWFSANDFAMGRHQAETETSKLKTLAVLNNVINQPRPLSKVARMVIRKYFGNKVKQSIELLPLPTGIKDFLNLPELDIITPMQNDLR